MSAAPFVRRHIGPSSEDISEMTRVIGVMDVAALIDETIPAAIRRDAPLRLPAARSEEQALADLREMMERNELAHPSSSATP